MPSLTVKFAPLGATDASLVVLSEQFVDARPFRIHRQREDEPLVLIAP